MLVILYQIKMDMKTITGRITAGLYGSDGDDDAEEEKEQELRSPDLVALEYAELNLTHNVTQEVGHFRIRQHANPLSSSLAAPVELPDWNHVFEAPNIASHGGYWKRHFMYANATTSFNLLVSSYPGPLMLVSILVLIQSDVLDVALEMRNQFDSAHVLKHIDEIDSSVPSDSEGWLLSNPMGIRTEREVHAESEGAKIYRRLYQKQVDHF